MRFHFDDGADLTYALNVDKDGAFYGEACSPKDFFASSMQYGQVRSKKNQFGMDLFLARHSVIIEMKDAYAPYWGFSRWDLAFGSAGAFWPVYNITTQI